MFNKNTTGGGMSNDLEVVKNMLEKAEEYGLQAEVVLALFESKVNNKPLRDCVFEALYEWDLF